MLKATLGVKAYSRGYYKDIEKAERHSVTVIAEWISDNLKPLRAVDVGCGPGHLAAELSRKNIQVLGLDVSEAAIANLATKGLRGQKFDLTDRDSALPESPWDLVICMEVAEHLESSHADNFVRILSDGGNCVYLTAAEPSQTGGFGSLLHYNEQPNGYWIDRFTKRGFSFNSELTQVCRNYYSTRDVIEYLAKPMIFERKSA